jgi:hypothetical protein
MSDPFYAAFLSGKSTTMMTRVYLDKSAFLKWTPRSGNVGFFLTAAITMVLLDMNDAIAKPATEWLDDITLAGQIEGGINANVSRPANGINFGQFFGDRANQAQLDQLTLTAARAVDTTASSYDVGFMVRGLYGAEGRYFNIAGITDRLMTSRYQFIVPQAHLDVHLPWLTRHGLDMQAGILASPMGVESLDPSLRPFYTLSYTTEYSTPFEHVGAIFQWHLTDHIDLAP